MNMHRQMFGWASTLAVMVLIAATGALAQEDSDKSSSVAESLEKLKDNLLNNTGRVTPKGWETGNLSESGAREILTDANFESALEASTTQPVLVFKHSTECPISGDAYRHIASWLKKNDEDAPPIYLVKVIERRPVSKNIEAELKVKHESPQLILLDKKKPVWNTSHEAIVGEAIDKALQSIADPDGD